VERRTRSVTVTVDDLSQREHDIYTKGCVCGGGGGGWGGGGGAAGYIEQEFKGGFLYSISRGISC
jgi:hypothetical protein